MKKYQPMTLSDGQEAGQVPLPASGDPEAPRRETSSPDSHSVATHPGSGEAGNDLSSSSPKPGIRPGPNRDQRGTESSARRIIKRIVEVRRDLFGEEGAPAIAEALQLPLGTWLNYERGVVMSAPVLLYFLDLTSVEPHWLLTGRGPKYYGPRGR